MADEALRLGIDPRPAEEGFRRYDEAAERSIQATERLAQTVASAENVYQRAARERIETSRLVMSEAHSEAVAMNQVMASSNQLHAEAIRWNQHYDQVVRAQTRSMSEAHAEALRMNAAFGAQNVSAVTGVRGLGRLNTALASMARQAAGTHPIVGQLANTMSTFALGAATTTAVLGGMALVALAIRKIGEDSRFAKDRLEEQLTALRNLAAEQRGDDPSLLRFSFSQLRGAERSLADLVAERDALGAGPSGGHRGVGLTEKLDREIAEAERLVLVLRSYNQAAVAAGVIPEGPGLSRGSGGSGLGEMFSRATEAQGRFMLTLPELSEYAANPLHRLNLNPYGRSMGEYLRGGRIPIDMSGISTDGAGDLGGRTATSQYERDQRIERQILLNTQRRLREEEQKLADGRERANASLVIGLANVGRAYGGVADQVLNLAAATLSLERMPMVSGRDRAMAYSSAALAGVGYGASTGNPGLGGLGGAASGFAMTGTPQGMIVGAVAGIVSGLFEQGQRAQEAARIWKMAMEDYALLFDELTPEQRYEQQNRRQFMQNSGGFTPEQIQAALGSGANSYGLERVFGLTRAQMEELNHWYIENAKQAGELAKNERDLNDARSSSLNNPSGMRLSLYRWMHSGVTEGVDSVWNPLKPDKGSGSVTINLNVTGVTDPAEVSRRVVDEIRRSMKLGGPDPFLPEPR